MTTKQARPSSFILIFPPLLLPADESTRAPLVRQNTFTKDEGEERQVSASATFSSSRARMVGSSIVRGEERSAVATSASEAKEYTISDLRAQVQGRPKSQRREHFRAKAPTLIAVTAVFIVYFIHCLLCG